MGPSWLTGKSGAVLIALVLAAPPSGATSFGIGDDHRATQVRAWSDPVRMAGPTSITGYDVAVADDGRAVIVWSTDNVVFARVRAPGEGWRATVQLGHGDGPRVAMNGRGGVAVAWTRVLRNDMLIRAARRGAAEAAWHSATVMRGTVAYGTDHPAVAIGAAGQITVAVSLRTGERDPWRPTLVTYAHGRWSEPARVSPRFGTGVEVAAGRPGQTVVVWSDGDSRACTTRSRPRAGHHPAWTRTACFGPKHTGSLKVALDEAGRTYVMSGLGVWSRAPEGRWHREKIRGGDLEVFDEFSMALDASSVGRAAILWSRGRQVSRDEIDFKMYAAVRSPDGTWSRPRRVSSSGSPAVGITSDGTTYAVWNSAGAAHVAVRTPQGTWRRPVALRRGHAYPGVAIAVGPRGQALLGVRFGGYPRHSLYGAWHS